MVRLPETASGPRLEGRTVVVVGLGRSGQAAARLVAARGGRVVVTDRRGENDLGDAVREARSAGAEVLVGGHPPDLLVGADLVVVSPGVPLGIPFLEEARRLEIPVWGEVELASRYCRGRILGITGSNGKSTVTSMAGAILRAAGIPGGTGGNLGTPLADLLEDDAPDAVHAVELSSFQLESIEAFRAAGAVVVNLSPDHLDRYDSFDDYARAKARLLLGQEIDGFAILNADDPESERLEEAVRARLFRFSTRSAAEPGAWLRDGVLTLSTDEGVEGLFPADELPVPGEHNRANALAAALACRLLGCPVEAVVEGLRGYRALPHRLEHVATVNDVAFYDDSKATNLDAAARALQSFPTESVILILGGRDKGADWQSFAPLVRRHARRVLLVGEAGGAIRAGLGETVHLSDCGTIPEAVRAGFGEARPGDVVLLSPGCASFDQYRNFEERGDDFQRAVRRLPAGGGGRA